MSVGLDDTSVGDHLFENEMCLLKVEHDVEFTLSTVMRRRRIIQGSHTHTHTHACFDSYVRRSRNSDQMFLRDSE